MPSFGIVKNIKENILCKRYLFNIYFLLIDIYNMFFKQACTQSFN